MADPPAVLQWARSVHLEQPVRWGQVEAEVLSREPLAATALPVWVALLGVLGWAWVAFVTTVTLGAPALGLVFVVVGAAHDDVTDGRTWFAIAGFALVAASLTLLLALRVWWVEERRRQVVLAVGGGLALVCSGAAVVVLAVSGAAAVHPRVVVLAVVAGVLGAVVLVVTGLSAPGGRARSRKPPRRGPRSSARSARYVSTREAVLDVLAHRGVITVDDDDRIRMREMPLGYWEELDGVDERERRRILELRLTGWRDFDENDRRAWPPAPPAGTPG